MRGARDRRWIRSHFDNGAAVLLLGSIDEPMIEKRCRELLSSPYPASEIILLLLYRTERHDNLLDYWLREADHVPYNWTIIEIGSDQRCSYEITRAETRRVENPLFLIKTKHIVGDFLDNNSESKIVFIDSLSAMLRVIHYDIVYILIDSLLHQISDKGGFTFVSMDPKKHSDETIEIFAELFDGVAEISENSGWIIQD